MSATAKKNNMRLIAVVMGEESATTRNAEISAMLDYGFAQYEVETLLTTKSILGVSEVEKGKKRYVDVIPMQDITFLNKKMDGKKNATYKVKMNNVKAPIKYGDVIGKVIIYENKDVIREVELTAKEDVEKANIFQIYFRYLKDIITGHIEM